MRRALMLCALAALVFGAPRATLADIILVKDGTYLDGKVIAEDDRELTIEVTKKGVTRKVILAKADIVKRIPSKGAPAAPRPGSSDRGGNNDPSAATPGQGNPSASRDPQLGKKVMFLVDASGSMSLGGRFAAAKAKVVDMVQAMDDDAELDLIFFHSKAESFFGKSYLRASDRVKKRLPKLIKKASVKLYGGTNLELGLYKAVQRRPDTIVLISDGIVTEGQREPRKILEALDAILRKERLKTAPTLISIAVQNGEFPPNPKVERKAAARAFLDALSRERGGRFEALRAGGLADDRVFAPLSGSGPPPKIEARYYKSRKPLTSIVLGPRNFFPSFHLRIVDRALLRGPLAISEYPAGLALKVFSYDRFGNLLGSTPVPFGRKDGVLFSTRYLKVVGPVDNQEQHGSHLDKRVYLKALPGGYLKVVYTRAGQDFEQGFRVAEAGDPRDPLGTGGRGNGRNGRNGRNP